ncbi:hypothetical protein JTE90_009894 [Oedothorax gibbosus]|uniref:Prokineticin domain-containing protein n=1 Tax=Oedothorax gibbosus TaxID=931172 RepID=A0AAV6UUP7_9ARAC|nr:hypothetical protein JTE90_009894 [Oedothorax gibbosus]
MNLLFGITCLTACLAVVASKYFCTTAEDCKDGECCVAWSSVDLVKKGYCMKLERRGSRCNKVEAKVEYYGGKYVHYCPCAEGLVCEPKGGKDYKGFVDSSRLRCRQIPTTVDPDVTTVTEPEEEATIPTVIAEGPGGEPPRDDDCENWEYPC